MTRRGCGWRSQTRTQCAWAALHALALHHRQSHLVAWVQVVGLPVASCLVTKCASLRPGPRL